MKLLADDTRVLTCATYDFYDIKHDKAVLRLMSRFTASRFVANNTVLMVAVFKRVSFHHFITVFRRIFRENGDNSVLDTHVDDIANMVDSLELVYGHSDSIKVEHRER